MQCYKSCRLEFYIKYFIIGMPKGAAGRVVNSNNI